MCYAPIYLFIYLFLAVLGLCFCARAFSRLWQVGAPLHRGARASHYRGLSRCGARALERRLSSCGSRPQLLCGMWDLPRPALEPVSPALAGGFSTTAPPGKPRYFDFSKDIGSFDFYAKSLLIQMLIQIIKTAEAVHDHAW